MNAAADATVSGRMSARPALVLLVVLGLTSASMLARAADDAEPAAKAFQEYYHSFQGDPSKHRDFDLLGPNPEECVRFEPAGLRITVPPGKWREGPRSGVVAPFTITGDFEITIGFEILAEPEPGNTETGTRLTLGIALDTPQKNLATLSRAVQRDGPMFFAWISLWDAATNKPRNRGRGTRTSARTGRLRMVRTAADLLYYASAGADEEFTLLQKYPFPSQRLQHVSIVANSGGPQASLDARVSDLRIRAESISAAPALSPIALSPGPVPVVLTLGLLITLAFAFGVWLCLRRRYRSGD
jgi:hypothetical protein